MSGIQLAIYEQTQGKLFPSISLLEKNYRSPYSIRGENVTDAEKVTGSEQWKDDFRQIIRKKTKKLNDDDWQKINRAFNESSTPLECYDKLANDVLKKRTSALEEIRKTFRLQDTAKQDQQPRQIVLFEGNTSPETHKFFYNDPMAWKYIKGLIPPNYKQEAKRELFDWFVKDLKLPTDQRQWYKRVDVQDNTTVITKFCNQQPRGNFPYFTEDIREKVRKCLMSIYCQDDK